MLCQFLILGLKENGRLVRYSLIEPRSKRVVRGADHDNQARQPYELRSLWWTLQLLDSAARIE